MTRALLALVALSLLAGCGSPGKSSTELTALRAAAKLAPCPSGVGEVPSLRLSCLGGGPAVDLRGHPSGVPTLVNVYGSWCAPCQAEMPVLVSFARRAQDKVALLGIDTEDDRRQALLFARDLGQHWPAVVHDDGRFLRRYSTGPPVTLFVDGRGRVVFVKRGPFASVAEIAAAVRLHLGVLV